MNNQIEVGDMSNDIREIALTKNMVAVVNSCDYEWLSTFKWFAMETASGHCYACRRTPRVNGRQGVELMHRAIMRAASDVMVDHRDGNGLNNTRENLRFATRAENNRNARTPCNNTSGYKGVCWHKKYQKWQAYVNAHGKKKWLGYFATAEEAALAYNVAASFFHGDFVRYNEVETKP